MNGGPPAWLPAALPAVALAWIYATLVVVGMLALSTLAGHALARMPFRWHGPLFWLALVLLLMPDHVLLPSLHLASAPGGTLEGQFAWRIAGSHHMRLHLALGVLLLRQCFRRVPAEYERAAQLEGAGPWQGFFRAALPLATPVIALLALFVSRAVFDAVHALHESALARGGMIDFLALARDWRNSEVAGILVGTAPLPLVFLFGLRRWSRGRVSGGIRG
ncbi:MAG: ABC transporter permease subunit [Anaerolineaceae bacterium]|nr:ABC transporter permease subunit [Anaerolineaceae bacterium]MCY3906214.1 ABC transporter permease subunit [Anaerolineaceae bacterium]